jgi:UDP-N-acetylmuramoyl-L-alanyl-D-glutamate--2,6-diaminopimelate ligase
VRCGAPGSPPRPARLSEILEELPGHLHARLVRGSSAVRIAGVVEDHRKLSSGEAFIAIKGGKTDGLDYLGAATEKGASAVIVEEDRLGKATRLLDSVGPKRLDLAVISVAKGRSREALGWMTASLWGHPDQELKVCGVTGTNGKTTVTHMLAAIFEAAGWPTLLIGTLGCFLVAPRGIHLASRIDNEAASQEDLEQGPRESALGVDVPGPDVPGSPVPATTPGAPELFSWLAWGLGQGAKAASMEVSSHALAQDRVAGIHFSGVVFTNLGRDHLDYHQDMESYFLTKAKLFEPERTELAVVMVDDPYGARLAEMARLRGLRVVTVHRSDAKQVVVSPRRLFLRWDNTPLEVPLGGRFNVDNILLAAALARELGIPASQVAEGLARMPTVKGRFEVFSRCDDAPIALVDYAHTPDALRSALVSARELVDLEKGGRLTVVFGCGGERDKGKRPEMGKVAWELADRVVVTSDNPRSEAPGAIASEILSGIGPGADTGGREPPRVILDRREAILQAIGSSKAGDVVLVAGKGHETEQIGLLGSQHFDDTEVVREALGLTPDFRSTAR